MEFVFKLLQVWSASPHEQEEYLDCLWAQISKLREDEWKEKHILHYYVAFDGTLADAQQHNIRRYIDNRCLFTYLTESRTIFKGCAVLLINSIGVQQ